jgi:HD-GYP domain-containing protein (c-di-GMP phosphodiesterase class II)
MQSVSTKQFIVGIVTAALVAVGFAAYLAPGLNRETIWAAAFFALVGILGYALAYQLPRGGSGNISFIPFLSGLAAGPGLPLVFAVVLAVTCGEIVQRREGLKAAFNVAQYALAISLALCVYVLLGGKPIDSVTWGRSMLPFAVAYATFLFANSASVSGVMAVSQRRSVLEIWKQNTQGAIRYDFLALPFVYGFAFVYVKNPWLALGVALPLFGLRQLYKTNWQLETINEELLQLMVAAIEARDPYTSGHSRRVALYSRVVARAAGLHARAVDRLATAALLHDVGKIHEEFAPILRKPGRLTADEFAIMRTHPEKGAVLVAKVTQFRDLVPAIRGHHEAWNGSGYPDNLAGDKIPLWARVIMFADTIDAMTTDRPYREALTIESVREELRAQAGLQFDPRITAELVADKYWLQLAEAIRSNHDSAQFESLAIDAIPRHTGSAHPVSA